MIREHHHERLDDTREHALGSNRSFGFVFATVAAVIGAWPMLDARAPRLWALIVAGAFLLLALAMPAVLAPLNQAWSRLGYLLQRIVSPIVLAFIFYVGLAPVGWIMRLLNKDLLRLASDPEMESYWIERSPPGPSPDSMRKQF